MLMGRVRAGGAVMVGVVRSDLVMVCGGGVVLLVAAAAAVAALALAWADLERVMMGSRGLIVALVVCFVFLESGLWMNWCVDCWGCCGI